MTEKLYTLIACCFCGKGVRPRDSHNPQPASMKEGDRCCDDCNRSEVIPARLLASQHQNIGYDGGDAA